MAKAGMKRPGNWDSAVSEKGENPVPEIKGKLKKGHKKTKPMYK